jgi:hypothetical protein
MNATNQTFLSKVIKWTHGHTDRRKNKIKQHLYEARNMD